MSRVICWFSAGAASAVATKLALEDHPEAVVIRIDTRSEHPDQDRFTADCERWFGRPVRVEASDTHDDTWDVWTRRRFIVSPQGAPCTVELKKRVRERIERPDDLHVFGYTAEESHRAERFREQNPGVEILCPLIDRGLTKAECLAIIDRAGIELPAMYLLGYQNNNCIGCPKGGMGYWNMIRRDFPETFDRMSALERDLGHAVLREGPDVPGRPAIWLDELDPERGDIRTDPEMSCSLNCAAVDAGWTPPSRETTP